MTRFLHFLLLSILSTAIYAGRGRGRGGKGWPTPYPTTPNTPAPTTPSPTTSQPSPAPIDPSNAELCGCYDIDLICDPFEMDGETCYYYSIQKVSDADFCGSIQSFILSDDTTNCQNAGINLDIDDIVLDHAPKCYNIDGSYIGSPLNGIRISPDTDDSSSGSYYDSKSGTKSSRSSSDSSYKNGRWHNGRYGSSKSDSDSSSKSNSDSSAKSNGYGSPTTTSFSVTGMLICILIL